MSVVYEVDARRPAEHQDAILAAARAAAAGGLVVFPTDTVYAIATRPDDALATGLLFEAKRRAEDLALPVLVSEAREAWEVAERTRKAEELAWAFWPGSLTLVLPRAEVSRSWSLGTRTDSLAVRVPGSPLSLALLGLSGPLAVTSANISGEPPLMDGDRLQAAFGDAVAVYLLSSPSTEPGAGVASTVVDLTGDQPRILREGHEAARVEAALAGMLGEGPG